MARLTIPRVVSGLALLGASASLMAFGVIWMTTDASVARAGANAEPPPIPEVPAIEQPQPAGTDAFTRPMFHRNREPGPDKTPETPATEPSDPSTPEDSDAPDDLADASSFVLKGIIIGQNGARAAMQASDGGDLVWVRPGETLEGWKVDSITSNRVRISYGDEVVEINVREDK